MNDFSGKAQEILVLVVSDSRVNLFVVFPNVTCSLFIFDHYFFSCENFRFQEAASPP